MRTLLAAALTSLLLACPAWAQPAGMAGVYEVTDYGAVGDGVVDDGPAIQSAINAAVAGGGGTVMFPAGRYRLATGLYTNMGHPKYVSLHLRGAGGTSTWIIADLPTTTHAMQFSMSSVNNRLIVEHLTFLGKTMAEKANSMLRVDQGSFAQTSIRDVNFMGLAVDDGLIKVTGGSAIIERIGMHAVYSRLNGAIHSNQVTQLRISNLTGTDYFSLSDPSNYYGQGTGYYSNSGSCCRAWIAVTPPPKFDARTQQGTVVIEDLSLDEGMQYGILLGDFSHGATASMYRGTSAKVQRFFHNHSSVTGAVGVYAWNYDDVTVTDYGATWSHYDRDLVTCGGVGTCRVENLTGEYWPGGAPAGPHWVSADANTQLLEIINSKVTVSAASNAVRTVQRLNGVDTWTGMCVPEPAWCPPPP